MHVSRVTPSLQQEAVIDCSLQELRHGEESPDVATSLPSSALYSCTSLLAYLVVPLSLHVIIVCSSREASLSHLL